MRGGQASPPRAKPWENASSNIVASVVGWFRETGKEDIEADIAKIIALVDDDMRDLVKRFNCPGPNATHGFIHFKDGCVEQDIWSFRSSFNSNAPVFTIKGGKKAFIGPKKGRDQMQVDMQISNLFKAMCEIRKVEFEYGEQQALKAQAAGIRRGYKRQAAIWADEYRVVLWNYDKDEIEWDDYKLRLCKFRWDEVVKVQAQMARDRIQQNGKGGGRR